MIHETATIHPTAIIDPSVIIHAHVNIGAYCVIGNDVLIGENTVLHSHVVVHKNTRIGASNEIYPFASIGADPQDLKYKKEITWLEIGDFNTIRESCSLHRGTIQDQCLTKVGNHNLFMVNTHLAHDCIVGDHCVLANNVGVAGHVKIGNNVIIGGNSGVHQFCQINSFSMVGGGSTILKDIPAYIMVSGNPANAHGMNIEGMKRRGMSTETINTLRSAFKIIYKQQLTVQEAVEAMTVDLLPECPEVQYLIDSLVNSTRGIVR